MTKDKTILIKNIYYMLSYAFDALNIKDYEKIDSESFDNINNLFSEILYLGITHQLKRGLYKQYESHKEDLSTLKGKIELKGTIDNLSNGKNKLQCTFDEFSENNEFNQILKTTAYYLIHSPDVGKEKKNKLRIKMAYFSNVELIAPKSIHWSRLTYQRNNRSYRLLMNICYFVLSNLLFTTEKGLYSAATFKQDEMYHLYEKFILEYYRKAHPELNPNPSPVQWNLNGPEIDFLPGMITDVTLSKNGKTLILDAKYYSHELQNNNGRDSFHSDNIYQIFSYVKNKDKKHEGNVSGMLLYAKVEDEPPLGGSFNIDGNQFEVRTLDLSKEFKSIKAQLESIVKTYFI